VGRGGATLAAILASHALIHTADGNHFRDALAHGCQAMGLRVARIPQRELVAHAAAALGKPPDQLAATVTVAGAPRAHEASAPAARQAGIALRFKRE
jgi:hypothetical protein